jgi:hypothetical protein
MSREETIKHFGQGLASLLAVYERRQSELNAFFKKFRDHYEEKICDAYLHFRRYGVTHYIYYDKDKCVVVRPVDCYDKGCEEPRTVLETSNFTYDDAWSLRFTLEKIYMDEKDKLFGFQRAFVFEHYNSEDSFKPTTLDYAVMRRGFTNMKLGEPVGLLVKDEGKLVNNLEGRILEVSDSPDKNRKPC